MEENGKNDAAKEAEEERCVDEAFDHLVATYVATRHRKKVDLITKAFHFARQAHKGVRRLSGEPYIMHPIAVAQIACEEMGLGSTSICSALLHDVVEDTDYTVEDIENIFGPKVAQIVDGLTKISGGIFGEHVSAQAENIKKLLLTMNDDIRVILIKICDRLHNMRTLAGQPINKRYKIAGETLYIYAPLANRLGLNRIKNELENLSFRYEHPEEYEAIAQKLSSTQASRDTLFALFTEPIKKALDDLGLRYQITARVKTPYSIWSKMQTKHVTFEQIYDILAVRIIFTPDNPDDEVNDCFRIYVAISKIYKSHPDRLRDWVNHPKANGYQSLHVTLMSKQGQWIEVQIRSERMDEVATQGFAAHWKYKEGDIAVDDDSELNSWLSTIKEILDDPQPDAMDFLDTVKMNLFASEIFVFTPKGEIKTMPAGCSVLDFAFAIHTFLGSHCIGAKVNHKLVPISHKLQSGDQVEILTSKSQHIKKEWINFASTAKAKGKIQAMARRDDRETQHKGETILQAWLKERDTQMTTSIVNRLCSIRQIPKPDDLLLAIGNGDIVLSDNDYNLMFRKRSKNREKSGWRKFVPFLVADKQEEATPADGLSVVGEGFDKKKAVVLTDSNIQSYVHPDCCHPIPGDDILGYINNNNHIEIHKRDCEVAIRLKTGFGNRILDAKWKMSRRMYFDATIEVHGIDRKGMIRDVADVLSDKLNINIRKVTISSHEGIFDGMIEIGVHDRDEVKLIMKSLKKINGLTEVQQLV